MLLKYFNPILITVLLASCGGGGGTSNNSNLLPDLDSNGPVDNSIWSEASPESVGMDSISLSTAFDEAFIDGTFTQAAVVIKDSKLVYERYRGIMLGEKSALVSELNTDAETLQDRFGSRDKNSLASSWSTAKSFTSVMVAIAIEQGFIESLEESASVYINEWANDERAQITIRNLLDMRSGLPILCADANNPTLVICSNDSANSGGNLTLSDNQMDECIARQMAATGIPQPWYTYGSTYESGYWVYSNCDTMVLGEILFRATGQDLQTYADRHLFSKIGMTAYWWRDNTASAQVDGNYLAYCCLDATPRDFAKFGQLLLNNGAWNGEQVIPASYIDKIKNIVVDSRVDELTDSLSYGLQFWTTMPVSQSDGSMYPPANTIYATQGFDGQYIMIDFDRNLVVVRTSLYYPALTENDQRKMNVNAADTSNASYTATLPAAVGASSGTSYNNQALLYKVTQSITSQ
ncbi:MAG: serine hydrolase domain-containing protein [Porticoccaceae bacterium]